MPDSELMQVVDLPFCQAIMLEDWNAAPGRFFAAYRARGTFSSLLGNGVVDEFRTISGPVMLAPARLLGSVYDAALHLSDTRDPGLDIDQGWPPLTVGIESEVPEFIGDRNALLLRAVQMRQSAGVPPWQYSLRSESAAGFSLQHLRCSVRRQYAASVLTTNAPLLPQQLDRLADCSSAAITIAVSTGNRLARVDVSELQTVAAVSEQILAALVASASRLEALEE